MQMVTCFQQDSKHYENCNFLQRIYLRSYWSHAYQPVSQKHPCRQLPTGTVTLKADHWKTAHLNPILTKKVWNLLREGRAGSLNPWRFTKQQAKWSAKDQLKNKKSATPANARHWALATTLHHVTYASGVMHWPQWDANPQLALVQS